MLLDTKVCDVNAQNKAGYTSIMLAAVVPMTNDFERSTLKRLFAEGNVNIKSTDMPIQESKGGKHHKKVYSITWSHQKKLISFADTRLLT